MLSPRGLTAAYPDAAGAAELLAIIKAVKAGDTGARVTERFHAVADAMAGDGVTVMLVACTELSVLDPPQAAGVVVLDTLDVLAQAVITTAGAALKTKTSSEA